jgi:FAD-linked sulfhydryl oxidase
MARRQHVSVTVLLGLAILFSLYYIFSASSPSSDASSTPPPGTVDLHHISSSILTGGSIAPKLENATAK